MSLLAPKDTLRVLVTLKLKYEHNLQACFSLSPESMTFPHKSSLSRINHHWCDRIPVLSASRMTEILLTT